MTKPVTKHRIIHLILAVCGHLLAITTTFGVFMSFFMTEHSMALLQVSFWDPQIQPDVIGQGLLLYGLAACAWALCFIIYKLVRSHVDQPKHVSLKKARGTVITETLVVFPIFLLLTFGLAQMALTSIAGLLTTLASFEVTRSLAVWGPEEGNPHGGSPSEGLIRERMRLKAAMTIAPATPEFSMAQPCASPLLGQALAGLTGAGLNAAPTGQGSVYSFAEALGSRTFRERGPAKLTGAFCAIEVEWTDMITDPDDVDRDRFTSTLRYHHPTAMPLVGLVFARNMGAGPWVTPYVSTITREYRLTQYLTPNDQRP